MDINSILANEVNKNAVVNTFTKGMNTDTSDSMMPSDQYRIAYNLRLITNNSENNGELSTIEGYSYIYDLFVDVAAATLIRLYGIVVDRKEAPTNPISVVGGQEIVTPPSEEWSIYTIVKDGDLYDVTRIFGPCDDPLGDAVSLVTRYEDDDNVKLYIADGKHPLMSINIVNPPNASLTPNSTFEPRTNIKYISSYSEHTFKPIDIHSTIAGSLKPSIVLYAYILYNKYGKSSNLSPLSQMKVITKTVNKGNITYTSGLYKDETGHVGYELRISESILSGYERVKMFRITYVEIGQDPVIDVIYDDKLPSTPVSTVQIPGIGTQQIYDQVIYNDRGGSLYTMSYAEFLALQKIPIIPTEIESKNDYLFASNIKYLVSANNNIISEFASLDLSSQISDSNYLNLDYHFFAGSGENYDWTKNTGTYIDWEIKESYDIEKSLRRDEVYRYGIVLYDKYENAWPVKWICDLRTPPIHYGITKRTLNANGELLFSKLYVKFTINWDDIINLFTDTSFFKSFEIVRCKRTEDDRYTITQGIIGRPFECYKYLSDSDIEIDVNGNTIGTKLNMLCPTGYMTTTRIVAYPGKWNQGEETYGVGCDDIVMFSSPEICYQHDDMMNLLTKYTDLKLKPVWEDTDVLNEVQDRNPKFSWPYSIGYHGNIETMVHPLSDGSIPGMAFFGKRVDVNDSNATVSESSAHGSYIYALWVYTRLFGPYHEPYEYNNISSSSITGQPDGRSYYNNVGGIEMRKTIYDLFFLGNGFTAESEDSSYYTGNTFNNRTCSVSGVSDINVPNYNEFANGTNGTFKNNSSYVNGKSFIPWSVPTCINWTDISEFSSTDGRVNYDYDYMNWQVNLAYVRPFYPVSSVGKSVLLKLSQTDWFNNDHHTYINLTATICNLRRTSVVPYGGFTDKSRQDSVYYSFGDYVNPSSSTAEIDVKSGDCFVLSFRYNAAKTFYNPDVRFAPSMATIYIFPVETDIDIDHELGWSSKFNTSAGNNMLIQDNAAVLRGYTLTEPCYIANTAYNTNETARYFAGLDPDDLLNVDYDYRVCYSNLKLNNESYDSWLNFRSANYIDVDTRYGLITDLRLFKDTLLFWLDNAVGVLSVNERTIIQDANDTNIVLGNGDVLQRYDYLTTEYGMKPNQYVDCQSNTTLYWWDGYRKEILSYSGGQSVTPMNKLKTIDNYINSNNEADTPAIAYDIKYNEVMFSVVGLNPIIYNENIQQFTSVYEVKFSHSIKRQEELLLISGLSPYKDGLVLWNVPEEDHLYTWEPYVKFVVNPQTLYNNIYDNMLLAGRFYGGNYLGYINMIFKTPLKLESRIINGVVDANTDNYIGITNREYDFRFAVPRAGHYVTENNTSVWKQAEWGDRMRGKVMECELSTTSSDPDFSLQYIITKYRKSWI